VQGEASKVAASRVPRRARRAVRPAGGCGVARRSAPLSLQQALCRGRALACPPAVAEAPAVTAAVLAM